MGLGLALSRMGQSSLRPAPRAARPVRRRGRALAAAAALLASAALPTGGAGGQGQLGALCSAPARRAGLLAAGRPRVARCSSAAPAQRPLPLGPVAEEGEQGRPPRPEAASYERAGAEPGGSAPGGLLAQEGWRGEPLGLEAAGPEQAEADAELDPTGKIGRTVGWLNRKLERLSGSFIIFDRVVEPLSQLDVSVALSILASVKHKADSIKNPTNFILAAAARHDATDIDLDPTGKIGKQVGWLNRYAGLQDKIIFRDVVAPLSRLHLPTAMKILSKLQERAAVVDHPTNYIQAAAKNARERRSAGVA